MSGWICNNCGTHFEGGIFNTRECPRCRSFASEAARLLFSVLKLLIMLIPVLIVIKVFQGRIYDNIMVTVKNLANLDQVVYYNPSFYFNNLIFAKEDSYYTLREPRPVYQRIIDGKDIPERPPVINLNTGQVVILKGIIPGKDNIWLAVEYYLQGKRQRNYIAMQRDWGNYLFRLDDNGILSEAKNDYRNAVQAVYEVKEISGRENIRKFSEENPAFFRMEMEDTYFLGPVMAFFSSDYDVAYFARSSDREKIEKMSRQYLDRHEIESRILEYKE
jgi:hypothetical protein